MQHNSLQTRLRQSEARLATLSCQYFFKKTEKATTQKITQRDTVGDAHIDPHRGHNNDKCGASTCASGHLSKNIMKDARAASLRWKCRESGKIHDHLCKSTEQNHLCNCKRWHYSHGCDEVSWPFGSDSATQLERCCRKTGKISGSAASILDCASA